MFLSIGLSLTAFGQSMSDAQLIQIAVQERKAGTPESDIAVKLLQRGATMIRSSAFAVSTVVS